MFTTTPLKIRTTIKTLTKAVPVPWLVVTLATLGLAVTLATGWPSRTGQEDATGALYRDPKQPVAARVDDLLNRMTRA